MNPFDEFNRIRTSPWTAPESITCDLIAALPHEGLRLSRILPLLAGIEVTSQVTGKEIFVRAAHLAKAFDALAEAARAGVVRLRGARGKDPAQDIPNAIFADPLTLVAGDDDAFGPDGDRWPDADRCFPSNYENLVWRRVTVERETLASWLSGAATKQRKRTKSVDVQDWLRRKHPTRPSLTTDELMRDFEGETKRNYSKRTFEKGLELAYRSPQKSALR